MTKQGKEILFFVVVFFLFGCAVADLVDKHSGAKTVLADNGMYYKDSWVGNIVAGRAPWNFDNK